MIAKDFPFMKEKHQISCKSFMIMKAPCAGALEFPDEYGRSGKPGSGCGLGRNHRIAPSVTAITKFAEEPNLVTASARCAAGLVRGAMRA
jgi:hypothetical protein